MKKNLAIDATNANEKSIIDYDALAAVLAPRVAALLGARSAPEPYSSHHLPPDVKTRAAFARHCRRIPEAERVGKVWICPRDAWARYRGGRVELDVQHESAESTTSIAERSGLRVVVSR